MSIKAICEVFWAQEAQVVKNVPANAGREGNGPHSNTLASAGDAGSALGWEDPLRT